MSEKIGLGDIVSFGSKTGEYDTGTVCQVYSDGTVDVFRPYIHTSDFSHAGSEEGSSAVICYIGTETVKRINPELLKLLRKCQPLR